MTDMVAEYSIIITTVRDKASGENIAKLLVENRLAACVQMFHIDSVYLWQNEICCDGEVALLVKTKTELFEATASAIKENHTYEVPEIIQIPITDGLPEYLKWIGDSTTRKGAV